ncbi:BrnT family toxin [Aestuariibius insulae]|uniref:BrnT family toxin n=1 Tax=Aestuariibius insulae TaxID=2058287 RepID=UPI00345E77C6
MTDWDEAKRRSNMDKHGVDFVEIVRFDWTTALTREDKRGDYGERRYVSIGYIADRLHVCVVAAREGGLRLISPRKANARERTLYEQA